MLGYCRARAHPPTQRVQRCHKPSAQKDTQAACSVLSVLLATVSARCVSVREGSDLGLEHEDAGCSRWARKKSIFPTTPSMALMVLGHFKRKAGYTKGMHIMLWLAL